MARKKNGDPKPVAGSPEVRRLLSTVKTSMRSLGYTNRDVERSLGLSGSYLSRLFSGLIDLKVDHIVAISRVVGMEPEEMFKFAFPGGKRPPSVAALRVREALAGLEDAEPEEAALRSGLNGPSPSELEQAMEKLMARAVQKLLGRLA